MNESEKLKQLLDEINSKREALSNAYVSEGRSERMLALNQEMDQLINKYYALIEEEKNKH
jgi:hypothetical protein